VYLDFLASKGKVGVEIHLRKCEPLDNAYDIKPLERIAMLLEVPTNRSDVKPTAGNLSGYVKCDKSKYIHYVFSMEYDVKKNRLRPSFVHAVPRQPIALKANDFINVI
jgi:hypothetical protein